MKTPLSTDLPIPPSPSSILDLSPLDSFQSDNMNSSENGHRLLVPRHPSHILVAYKPTLDFMNSLERKLNIRLANFQMFLDDFY